MPAEKGWAIADAHVLPAGAQYPAYLAAHLVDELETLRTAAHGVQGSCGDPANRVSAWDPSAPLPRSGGKTFVEDQIEVLVIKVHVGDVHDRVCAAKLAPCGGKKGVVFGGVGGWVQVMSW